MSLARAWAAFVCPTSVPSRASGSRACGDEPSRQGLRCALEGKAQTTSPVLTVARSPLSSLRPVDTPAQTLFLSPRPLLKLPKLFHKH